MANASDWDGWTGGAQQAVDYSAWGRQWQAAAVDDRQRKRELAQAVREHQWTEHERQHWPGQTRVTLTSTKDNQKLVSNPSRESYKPSRESQPQPANVLQIQDSSVSCSAGNPANIFLHSALSTAKAKPVLPQQKTWLQVAASVPWRRQFRMDFKACSADVVQRRDGKHINGQGVISSSYRYVV